MDRAGWDARHRTTELVWTADPNQLLEVEAARLAPGTALDLSAEEGRNAVWLAQRGWQLTAFDLFAVGLAKAAQLADAAGVTLTTVCAGVGGYVPPPGGFDLVVALYLQLPAPVRTAVHRRAADAVAAGGTLVVVGHDTTNLSGGHGGPQDPDVLFSPDDVAADVASSGLVIDRADRVHRADGVHRSTETADGERVAIDALVRAHRPGQR